MQDAASVLTDQFAGLLERLPAGLDLDRLALETKAIQPKREVVDGVALLRIALARGPGGLSLRQTAAWASMLGIAELSNPGVKYWLDQASDFLAVLVERLLAAKVPGAELRWPGRTWRLADGPCVSEPGSTGTDWRVHGVFDLGGGGFSHLELTDKQGAEALERGTPHPGESRIGMVLLRIILGPLSLASIVAAHDLVHRHLANAPRKRHPHVRYPVQDLF
jgi:hypothetical protein